MYSIWLSAIRNGWSCSHTHRSIWSAPSAELSFAILDVAAALSRPDLAIAMRPLIFWYGKRPATVLVYPNIRSKQWEPGKNTHAVSSAIIRERVAISTCARQVSKLFDPSIHSLFGCEPAMAPVKLLLTEMRHVRHRLLISKGG